MAIAIAIASEPIRARGIILLNIYKAMYKKPYRGRFVPQLSGQGILLCEHKDSLCSRIESLVTRFPQSRQGSSCFSHWEMCRPMSSLGFFSMHPLFWHSTSSFAQVLEWCEWFTSFPTHSQPLLVHFISSLEVMSSRTMLTFSAAPLGKTFLQRGHFGEDDMANAVAKQLWHPECPHAKVTGLTMVERLLKLKETTKIVRSSHQSHITI